MSISKIIGREGRLIWDDLPVSLKYWMIERERPDGGEESWHGRAIISQTDLRAMMEVQAKSRPIPINEPIFAEFHKGKEVYRGEILTSSSPDPVDSNPLIDFRGVGRLEQKDR